MKIGGKYRLVQIGMHSFRELAHELKLDADALEGDLTQMAAALPDHASAVLVEQRRSGLARAPLTKLANVLTARARACTKEFHTARARTKR